VKDVLVHLDMLLTVDFEINLDLLWQKQNRETNHPSSNSRTRHTTTTTTTATAATTATTATSGGKNHKHRSISFFDKLKGFGSSSSKTPKRSQSNTSETLTDALARTGFYDGDSPRTKEKTRRGTYTGRSVHMNRHIDDAIANVFDDPNDANDAPDAPDVPPPPPVPRSHSADKSRLAGLGECILLFPFFPSFYQ
jgi:hypothetical protein